MGLSLDDVPIQELFAAIIFVVSQQDRSIDAGVLAHQDAEAVEVGGRRIRPSEADAGQKAKGQQGDEALHRYGRDYLGLGEWTTKKPAPDPKRVSSPAPASLPAAGQVQPTLTDGLQVGLGVAVAFAGKEMALQHANGVEQILALGCRPAQ